MLDVLQQYEDWLAGHRRPFQKRRASEVKRDIGEKTGPWDDKLDAVPENDQYDMDDPFIDDEDDDRADADADYDSADNTSQSTEVDVSEDNEQAWAQGIDEDGVSTTSAITSTHSARRVEDLFNDDNDDLPGLSDSPPGTGQLSDGPGTSRVGKLVTSPEKRKYGSASSEDEDEDELYSSPPKRRNVAVVSTIFRCKSPGEDGLSDGSSSSDEEESQLQLNMPHKRICRRIFESQPSNEVCADKYAYRVQ